LTSSNKQIFLGNLYVFSGILFFLFWFILGTKSDLFVTFPLLVIPFLYIQQGINYVQGKRRNISLVKIRDGKTLLWTNVILIGLLGLFYFLLGIIPRERPVDLGSYIILFTGIVITLLILFIINFLYLVRKDKTRERVLFVGSPFFIGFLILLIYVSFTS